MLIAEKTDRGAECALLEDNVLVDYALDDLPAPDSVESVHLVKVERVMKSLNAAFVKMEGGIEGFLPLAKDAPFPKGGDMKVVQVKRTRQEGKACAIKEEISLTGRHLVYLPFGQGVKYSKRLSKEDRAALQAKFPALEGQGGVIFRRQALNASPEDIALELEAFRLQGVYLKEAKGESPKLLVPSLSPAQKMVRDAWKVPEKALTNCPLPWWKGKVDEHPSPFMLFGVREKLQRALGRVHYLKSGAVLIVDPCEALTAIDVNSANAKNKSAVDINKEAAFEIARLCRVRGTGGIIVIDFLKMEKDFQHEAVLKAMQDAFFQDPVQTTLEGFTRLGLFEMTRRRMQDKP
jgi:Ribonuclease G/E